MRPTPRQSARCPARGAARVPLATAIPLLAALLAAREAGARSRRVDLVPNGSVFMCITCHNGFAGGVRNSFGEAIAPLVGIADCRTEFWSPALAALDSDGDGRTNGEELGDPAGVWRPGDPAPGDPDLVTRPGVKDTPVLKPRIFSVDPREVSTLGGARLSISGADFAPSTAVLVGFHPLEGLELVDPTLITGLAPALDAAEPPGPKDVTVSNERGTSVLAAGVLYVAPQSEPGDFVRGEVTLDGRIDLSDAIALLQFLFVGGARPSCPDAADADDSGRIDISDGIFILAFLFLGGPPPPPPYPAPGPDPTADSLSCAPGGLSGLEVAPAALELPGPGGTAQLETTALRDGQTVDLRRAADGTTYASSDPSIVLVYRDGLVEARAPGEASITARNGDLEATAAVTVGDAADPTVKVLAASEYGLSFIDREFSVFSIHPPYGSLRAQVARAEPGGGVAMLDGSQVDLRYSPLPDGQGSETSSSRGKSDFWSAAPAAYGWRLEDGQGLLDAEAARFQQAPQSTHGLQHGVLAGPQASPGGGPQRRPGQCHAEHAARGGQHLQAGDDPRRKAQCQPGSQLAGDRQPPIQAGPADGRRERDLAIAQAQQWRRPAPRDGHSPTGQGEHRQDRAEPGRPRHRLSHRGRPGGRRRSRRRPACRAHASASRPASRPAASHLRDPPSPARRPPAGRLRPQPHSRSTPAGAGARRRPCARRAG